MIYWQKSVSGSRHRRYQLNRGQIFLTVALLLGLVVTLGLFGLVRPDNVDLERTAQTERALAQAKEALVAYAAARHPDDRRPGELPCPDTTNSGQADNACDMTAPKPQIVGRLPTRTLGIPDLRDGSGEKLWYTVSNRFKNNPALTPLNSNTPGNLTVVGLLPTSNAVAIVFAPGPIVAGQLRTAANINNVAHYLEGDNKDTDATFASAASSSTFNDRLLAITPSMFFPAVEMRVVRYLRKSLATYYGVNRYFPPANAFSGVCLSASQGMLPDPFAMCAGYAPWSAAPAWVKDDEWYKVIFYAVAPACKDIAALDCTGGGGFLTVGGVSGIHALLISPGTPYPAQARPCADIADCIESPNANSFPVFTHIVSSDTANDRLVIVTP